MKRVLIITCIVVGFFTLVELIIPGHLNLLLTYLEGIGTLFSNQYGTPTLQTPQAP